MNNRDGDLCDLAANLAILATQIAEDTLSDDQIKSLDTAIWLLVNNGSGTVDFLERHGPTTIKQDVLSKRIRESSLPRVAQTYLLEHGARFVGDLYRLLFKRKSLPRTQIQKFLKKKGLPPLTARVEVLAAWQNPTWSMTGFKALMNAELDTVLDRYDDGSGEGGDWSFRSTPATAGFNMVHQIPDLADCLIQPNPKSQLHVLRFLKQALDGHSILYPLLLMPTT